MLYGFGGLNSYDHTTWTGNIEDAYIDFEVEDGDMRLYKPAGERNKTGQRINMSLTVQGSAGGGGGGGGGNVGASATLGGSFKLGGGRVFPDARHNNMDREEGRIRFEGQTEKATDILAMFAGTTSDISDSSPDWRIHINGDRYNKCPVIC